MTSRPDRRRSATTNRTRTLALGGLLAAALVIVVAPLAGCSLAVKAGTASFNDAAIEDLTGGSTRDLWEIELGLGEYDDGRVDLAVSADFSDSIAGTDLQNARFTSRYSFLGQRRVSPYGGAGLGWFHWTVPQTYVIPEPFCYPDLDPFGCEVVGKRTLAKAYFPFAVAGVNIRTTERTQAIVETRYDFQKDDGPYEFDGFQINVGFRMRLSD